MICNGRFGAEQLAVAGEHRVGLAAVAGRISYTPQAGGVATIFRDVVDPHQPRPRG